MSTPGRLLRVLGFALGSSGTTELSAQDTAVVVVDTATANRLARVAADSAVARLQQKSESLEAVRIAQSQLDAPLVLTIGVEASNAGGFDETKVSPAVGISFIAIETYRPSKEKVIALLDSADMKIDRVLFAMDRAAPRLGWELALQAQFTQAASVHRFASCNRLPRFVNDTLVRGFPGDRLRFCGLDEEVGDTTFSTLFRTDSIRFSAVGVWRAFTQGRLEFLIDRGTNLRIGPIGGLGIQSNPNHLTDPSQQQLKVLGAIGLGMRRINPRTNTELFSFDVVYGAVQNYQVIDILGLPAADGTRPVVAEPQIARRTDQWQAFVSIRPLPGFRIRGFFTFNAPDERDRSNLGPSLPIPDLARVAFMTDRDLAEIIGALVGGGDGVERRTESNHPSPAL